MQFGKFFVSASAIVLPNDSYNILIGTQFLLEFKAKINYKEQYLSLLFYKVPLIILNQPAKPKVQTCYIESDKSISSLDYTMSKPGKSLPPSTSDMEGIPIYSPFAFHLEPGQQTLVNIHLSFEILKNYILFLSSVKNPLCMNLWYALVFLIKVH